MERTAHWKKFVQAMEGDDVFLHVTDDENTNVKTEAVAEPAVEAEEDSKSKCHVRAK